MGKLSLRERERGRDRKEREEPYPETISRHRLKEIRKGGKVRRGGGRFARVGGVRRNGRNIAFERFTRRRLNSVLFWERSKRHPVITRTFD